MSHQTQPRSKVSNSTILLLVVLLAIAAFLIGASGFGSVGAQNNPLGGPNPIVSHFQHPNNYIPLGDRSFPDALTKQIDAALNALGANGGTAKYFDPERTLYHFSMTGSLLVAALPIKNSQVAKLGGTNDIEAGQIVGALYEPQPNGSPKVLILVYPAGSNPGDKAVLYDSSGQLVSSSSVVMRTFTGVNIAPATQSAAAATQAATEISTETASVTLNLSAQIPGLHPTVADAGTIISASETCFTVGLDQICLEIGPGDPQSQKIADGAVANLKNALDNQYPELAKLTFDTSGAVSDVLGDDQRIKCAGVVQTYAFGEAAAPTECQPSAVWDALETPQGLTGFVDSNARVIGVLSIQTNDASPLKIDTVNNDGGELYDGRDGGKTATKIASGLLPKMDYLVLSTQSNPSLGKPTALYLVGADGKTIYLIPGLAIEAFGKAPSDKTPQFWHAFDKDGGIGGVWAP